MMRKLILAATFVTFFLPLSSMAEAPEYSSILPGLAKLYKDTAPSDLDKKLSGMADDLTPPKDIKELIAFTVKPLLVLGNAHYEAKRKCISDGIVAGYSVGVAGGLWSVHPFFVENRLKMRIGPTMEKCSRIFAVYYNAAVVVGYIEVLELPQDKSNLIEKKLTAHLAAGPQLLPGTFYGVDGTKYTGTDEERYGNIDFYYVYARLFRKHMVKRTNDDKVEIDLKALLDAVKDGRDFWK